MDHESRFRELRALIGPTVGVRLYRADAQTIPHNTDWTIVWTQTSYGFGIQLGETQSTITLPVSGLWRIGHQVVWADSGATGGIRRTRVYAGTRLIGHTKQNEVSGGGTVNHRSDAFLGRANEAIRLDVFQDRGGDLDTSGGETNTYLEAVLLTTVQAPVLG